MRFLRQLSSAKSTNYLDLTSSDIDGNGNAGWAQQYLPDLIEQEAEVYGKRNISGFLSAIGAEEAMTFRSSSMDRTR